ncbi:SDR family oxidoreductase [Novosphingobium sp. PP1Y]|uniref:SDR family oxidoreductase n=1 Tax=Novosphingobium sp. PP1Y TaxID=702113 RepID=UPI001E49A260|nr:SDR family oxidoreductase [Novosphingobium sp. PP1Y]
MRVNSVLPGPTRTGLTRKSVRQDCDFPLGCWVEAEDVAAAICFLISDDAAAITGGELVVDGGVSLVPR